MRRKTLVSKIENTSLKQTKQFNDLKDLVEILHVCSRGYMLKPM